MSERRALISVSDKRGIAEFARGLEQRGWSILSTGGTARLLAEQGIAVTEVSEYTGFPEVMDGRVKTLHPKIHGGILARRGIDDAAMEQHGISGIDLVAVNLYPFERTVARADANFEEAMENIDIGGPTMLRAAAKNHAHVAVVVDCEDYARVLQELDDNGGSLSADTRRKLAGKCFAHTARYESAIARYLNPESAVRAEETALEDSLSLRLDKLQNLRYGENPHQEAALYADGDTQGGGLARARQLHGKPLSYNNLADADAALGCVSQFDERAACVIVKHANPCGVALGADLAEAYQRAFATDPTSAFGGIIAFNREVDADSARALVDNQFAELVLAPAFSEAALEALRSKKNLRLLAAAARSERPAALEYKRISGGMLVQQADTGVITTDRLQVVTQRTPGQTQLEDLLFAWRVAKFVKSNAIVFAKNSQTVGIGAGQMSRVDSARIAGLKAADAKLEVQGAVMASDAFFPFRDGIDAAAEAGIAAVIQPGGSVRDEEVIAAANEAGMAMVFTGMRHFRH